MARNRKTTLGRAAVGLPRYYLDTGWWRGIGFAGLDATALFVWQAAVSYCTETSTDGRMPADLEDLSVSLGVRLSDLRKAVPHLLEKGRWVADGDQFVMPDWADHNPTKEEVEAYTAERSELGRRGNHERHHVKKGVVSPTCEFCPPVSDPGSDRSSDPGSDPARDRQSGPVSLPRGSHGMGWDGTSSKSESPTARSSDQNTGPVAEPTGPEEDHHTTPTDRVIALTITQMQANADRDGHPIRNPTAWRATVEPDLRDRHGPTIAARLTDGWTIEQVADGIIDPHYQPRPPAPDPEPDWTPEQRAANFAASADARARAKAAARRPDCDPQGAPR